MALQKVRLSCTIQDELNTQAALQSYALWDDGTTIAAAIIATAAWASAVNGVTDGKVTKSSFHFLLPGVVDVTKPVAGARVEQTGVINFRPLPADSPHRFGIAIPAISNSVITAGKIVLGSGNVQTLTNLLLAAVAGGNYSNTSFQVLKTVADALISFRERRKQLQRSSFE